MLQEITRGGGYKGKPDNLTGSKKFQFHYMNAAEEG